MMEHLIKFFSNFSVELAMIMDRLYGGVCYAGIDTDPELKYPKGAGRVAFSNQQSYIAAISARFVQLQHGEIDKRVSIETFIYLGELTQALVLRMIAFKFDDTDITDDNDSDVSDGKSLLEFWVTTFLSD